jgi:hypothetical protein
MRFISIVRSLESLRLICVSHFCLLILQHLLTYMFFLHYYGLWLSVYCEGRFCRSANVYCVIWLPYLHYLFLSILVHAHNVIVTISCIVIDHNNQNPYHL